METVGFAVRQEAASVAEGKHEPAADQLGTLGVPDLGIDQVQLGEGQVQVLRYRVGDERPDLGPGPVRTDQQVGGEPAAVGQPHLAVLDVDDLRAPADDAVRQAVDQQVAQVPAMHLGAPVALVLEVQYALPVVDPHHLATGHDAAQELVVQTGRAQRFLSGVLVDVEHAALGTGGR